MRQLDSPEPWAFLDLNLAASPSQLSRFACLFALKSRDDAVTMMARRVSTVVLVLLLF